MSSAADLRIEILQVRHSDLEPQVLPRLIANVFHVTSEIGFEGILRSGAIHPNKGQFQFTFPQSKNSYGRQSGYVCLFDLRNITDDILGQTLQKFYFPKPTAADPVFLFLKPSEYATIVPWTTAPKTAMLVPYLEAWYPGDLPLSAIDHALKVTVEVDDADSAFRGIMRRLHRDKEELLDSGLVTIEAHSKSELKQRAEEWAGVAESAGLQVNLSWDPERVVNTVTGFQISLHARRAEYWQNIEKHTEL